MIGPVTACRACGAPFGQVFCDLGTMAVANSACRMVQLDHIVDATGIFRHYAYFSSASGSWLDHARRFSEEMTARLGLCSGSLVIEVASNDGYLLRNFVAAGIPCLGIEPATNVAAVAQEAGVPTEVTFLDPVMAAELVARKGRADLVVANNVLAHVPAVNGFVAALALLTSPEGVLSVEVPHLLRLVDGVQFDTIYHEHYAYWSLLAVERLFSRHGLKVFDVEHLPTHGGSLRILASPAARPASAALAALRMLEAERGVDGDAFYAGFDDRVAKVVQGFRAWLARQSETGRKVAGYGAAAKGNTFLNAARVQAGDLVAVADVSPAKQGRLLPGSHIPVVALETVLAMAPDEILILPWNIASELAAHLRDAGFSGGIWVALPEMRRL
jgi:SAM-dependent methyltransferase